MTETSGPQATPRVIVVDGLKGRFAGIRTVWGEESADHFVLLDEATGAPQADMHGNRTEVFADGDWWNCRIWAPATASGRSAGSTLDNALEFVTRELSD